MTKERKYGSLREKIAAEKQERLVRYAEYAQWLEEAHQAGVDAVSRLQVVPMVVAQHENMLDDNSAVSKAWVVEGGVCGFAWITVRHANSSFALWLKKTQGDRWKSAYEGGIQLWVSEFGQSMQRKETYAHAYAEVLRGHGIRAYAGSRMD